MGQRWVGDRGKDWSTRGLGLWSMASGGRKIGQHLGKGIGPVRNGGRKKKINKREKRRAVASEGRGGSVGDWAGEMCQRGGGRQKNI